MKKKRGNNKNKLKNNLNFNLCKKRQKEICKNTDKCKYEDQTLCEIDRELCIVLSSLCNQIIINRTFFRRPEKIIVDKKKKYNRQKFKKEIF